MNWIDLAVAAAFILSIAVSVARGFIREACSLAAWVLAVVLSRLLAPQFSVLLPHAIESMGMRFAISSVILFILTLLVGNMVGRLVQQAASVSGLGFLDRVLGVVFGGARAVIIVLLAVIVIDWLGWFEKTQSWQTSKVLPYFLALQDWFFNLVKVKINF